MILLNASNIKVGGGIQVALSIIDEITKLKKHDVIFAIPEKFKGLFVEKEGFTYIYICKCNFFKKNMLLDDIVKKHNIHSVFTVFGPSYWKPKVNFHLEGFALPWIIYTDSPIFSRLSFFEKIKKTIFNKLRLFFFHWESDELWVETEDAKLRLNKSLKQKKIHVISNSVSNTFKLSCDELTLPPKNKDKKYFLLVSHWYKHKNIELLYEVDPSMEDNVVFILTVSDGDFKKIPINKQHLFLNVGPVSPAQCLKLYDYCDFVIQPSLLECFSANFVEAMYTQKLILTTDLDFSKTVCGDSAVYFNPNSFESFNESLNEIISLDNAEVNKYKKLLSNRIDFFMSSEQRANSIIEILECNNK